ncbi:MAG TPA: prepilin-type N-terminal cleavage/methylation domain-containing protein [Acidimicrobiia bacterium]|nr:prepilin-type N-terminal cleavage/methylation domain-containing protein [Acidimicrobiia bacterium]
MLKTIRNGLKRDEGFTLIELMVVVMIIAVLIAIAIPSFLGFRKSAQDRSAQSEVRNVLLSEKAFWLDNGNYTQTAADITAFEPNALLNADPALGVAIDLRDLDADIVCVSRTAASGNSFSVWESASAGTYYGATNLVGAGDCPAAAPGTYTQGGW